MKRTVEAAIRIGTIAGLIVCGRHHRRRSGYEKVASCRRRPARHGHRADHLAYAGLVSRALCPPRQFIGDRRTQRCKFFPERGLYIPSPPDRVVVGETDRRVKVLAQADQICRLFMTAPGVATSQP